MNILQGLSGLSVMTWLILALAAVGMTLVQSIIVFATRSKLLRMGGFLVAQGLFVVVFEKYLSYNITIHLIVFIPSVLAMLAIMMKIGEISIAGMVKNQKEDENWSVEIPSKEGKKLILQNVKRGVVIFGSAGSGKTESCFVPIIKHAGERSMPCLCYDYKNGELTEIANYFYQNTDIRKAVIIPHAPMYSDRVNPFAPKYIQNEQDLRVMTKTLFANIKKSDPTKGSSGHGFFDKIPETTLAAVIWRLKEDYPEFCTLPHAIAFCMKKDPKEISEFVDKNYYSSTLGTPLRDSLASENQVSGVKASLSLPLTDIAIPPIFWVLSGDDIELDINNPNNPTFLSVINDPQKEKPNAPFISVIISTAIAMMQVRNRPPSMLLFDEGTTFFIDNISRIPATMRSYNIATIFSTQDKALSKENYGEVITQSLLANLSYQMIGKTNDPESVRYYKQISEEIEKKTISKSYKDTFMQGDMRLSQSTRETSKYKNQDFTRLKPGQFFVFADGREQIYNLDLIPFKRVETKVRYHLTKAELDNHYKKIIDEAMSLE